MVAVVSVALVSGVVAGLPLIVPPLWPAAFLSLVPLLRVIDVQGCSRRLAAIGGFAWGAGLIGKSLSFVFAMLPFDWLGIANPALGALAALITWGACVSVLALPLGAFGLACWHLRRYSPWVILLVCPVAWVALEVMRATLYSLLVWAPGTSIGPYFTFGFLGYSLAGAHGLLWLAPLGGVLFLSWFVAFTNTLLFLVVRPSVTRRAAALCAGVAALLWIVNAVLPPRVQVGVGAAQGTVGDTQVALVHSDQQASFGTTEAQAAAARNALASAIVEDLAVDRSAQIVVLPEDSRFAQSIADASSRAEQRALAALASRRALLIGSSRSGSGAGASGVLYAYDVAGREPVQAAAKSYLVPFGEYVPYAVSLLGHVAGFDVALHALVAARASYVPAPWQPKDRIVEWQGVLYGVLSCSELFYPFFVKDLADAGADAIVVLSSQSWIRNGSPVLFNQMLGMAVVDAAWLGRPWLQATNGAPNVVVETAP